MDVQKIIDIAVANGAKAIDKAIKDNDSHLLIMSRLEIRNFAKALHDEFIKSLGEPMAYILRNEYNEYRLEPDDKFSYQTLEINVETKLYALPNDEVKS
jgi:hypothetical protein